MQWNMLADGLSGAHPDRGGFICSPVDSLAWSRFRQPRILEEILRSSCDIVCLEECDQYHAIEPILSSCGYDSIFYPKATSSCTGPPDGLACFYRRDRLSKGTQTFMNFPAPASQIGLWMKFSLPSEEKSFDLIVTHLKAQKDAEGEIIREAQMEYILDRVEESETHVYFVLGDFNATPTDHENHYPARVYPMLGRQELQSAYADPVTGLEPEYTTWKCRRNQNEVKHTLDYIWYTPGSIRCLQKLSIPPSDEMDECRMPSYRYPSDHMSLCAEFELL